MANIFEYDVFLSFASSDEELVKPMWQELCLSGLRVFWSDAALKNELGNSWIEIIESSLDRSRHMLLVCSPTSLNSTWVKREYRAFLEHCYKPGVRRLIPTLDKFLKDAADEELEKLEQAYLILVPEGRSPDGGVREEGLSVEVLMPQMGESIAEGTITRWLKKKGERVERDEPLFEISTDKVDAEIPAPAAGTLKTILFDEGATVAVNTTVAYILEETRGDKLSAAVEAGKRAYLSEKQKATDTSSS
jgi:hypothetical protein